MTTSADRTQRVIRRIEGASWLPNGRAEIVLSNLPPEPAVLVRVLLRRGREIFCVARDDGRQDIPTRRVHGDDPHGSATVRALALDLGINPESMAPLGFVRNVVSPPAPGYPWPMPLAHFSVWTSDELPTAPGRWVSASELRDRHWHPLLG
jgi:hypothetical protein